MHNWEASLLCGPSKMKKAVSWSFPPSKFNVDGAVRDKSAPAGIRGVLGSAEKVALAMFSKTPGIV